MFTDREHKPAMDTGAVQPFAQNLSLTSQRHLSTRVLGSRQVVNNSHLCVRFVCCTAACSLDVSVTYVSVCVYVCKWIVFVHLHICMQECTVCAQ